MVEEDEDVKKGLVSDKEGFGNKEVEVEPKVTLSKKGKGKKVANKSLASSMKHDASGCIVSSSYVKINSKVYKTVASKY